MCGSKITDLVGVQALVLLVLNFCTTTISVNISTVNNLTFFLMMVAYVSIRYFLHKNLFNWSGYLRILVSWSNNERCGFNFGFDGHCCCSF